VSDASKTSRPRVVVIGGGFGGLRAVSTLAGRDVDVTLIDQHNHHLFQPLLYQVATAGLAVSDIAMPLRAVLRKAKNVTVRLGEVTDVDTEAREVVLREGTRIGYDYAVVAAGANTRLPPGDAAEHVHGLKTLVDARAIRQQVLTCLERCELEPDAARRGDLATFVVVGGGPTGVEMAGALRELAKTTPGLGLGELRVDDVRVHLVELGPRVLAGFSESLSASAQEQLEALGVEVHTGIGVEFEGPHRVSIGDRTMNVGAVIWAAGVTPVSLAEALGPVARDGRVQVGPDCSLPHAPNVFAVGDIAHFVPEAGAAPLPGLAPVALQQGEHVARQILRATEGKSRRAFRYHDRGIMATIGRSRAVAQRGSLKLRGTMAWLAWLVVHLATLVGFRNRMAVFLNWAWAYLTYRRGHRILLPSARELQLPAPESSEDDEARRAS